MSYLRRFRRRRRRFPYRRRTWYVPRRTKRVVYRRRRKRKIVQAKRAIGRNPWRHITYGHSTDHISFHGGFLDTTADASFTDEDNLRHLTKITRGTATNNRIKEKLLIRKIKFIGIFTAADTTDATWAQPTIPLRFQILQHLDNATELDEAELFKNTGQARYRSPMKDDSQTRYKVLYDKRFQLGVNSSTWNTGIPVERQVSITIRPNTVVTYDNASSGGVYQMGGLWAVLSSPIPELNKNVAPKFVGDIKVYWTERS